MNKNSILRRVNFISKYQNLVISKSGGKSHYKIVQLEVENCEHLHSNTRSALPKMAFLIYEVKIWYQPHKFYGTGWMDGWMDGWLDAWMGGWKF